MEVWSQSRFRYLAHSDTPNSSKFTTMLKLQSPNPVSGIWLIPICFHAHRTCATVQVPIPFPVSGSFR